MITHLPPERTMDAASPVDLRQLAARLETMRRSGVPSLAIAIPVNAQGDLGNVVHLLDDLASYRGSRAVEIVLVVNNFPEASPPPEVATLRRLGVQVLAMPSVRRAGEAVGFSGRVVGAQAATAPYVVFFDADCRIPNATALLDWYAEQLQGGAHAAYTWVTYVDCADALAVRVKLAIHHASRSFKRVVLGIPTTQGCNYAVRRDSLLELYSQGYLADEMNVGPTIKALKGPVAYSRARRLHVLTSGRMFTARWGRIIPYFTQRLLYNLRVIPVRPGVARRTGRERDPVRRYVNNRPVRDETEATAARQ
ncbi:MAG TPA: glycosyltransferase [Gemmatimonadaceae bacterium]|nr:glycosyltransferase [Gemmatimonadaceae bacterium]